MTRYAVFGQPISHSLSPRIHAAFAAQLGIDLDYRAIEAGRGAFASALAAFARDGGRGANVTLPLKQDASALCSELSDRARRCGSVNTLARAGDEWHGDSTDGIGLLRDLARHGIETRGVRVLLLGAGGAARAAAFALADAGARELVVMNRTATRAQALAVALGTPARTCDRDALQREPTFDIVVNATSAGHAGDVFAWPLAAEATPTACYDLSYGGAARAFLAAARAAGARVALDGLGMLVEQAAESFALWHGCAPDTTPVHALLRAEA
ncbi:shikimate dehydrogenase [Dokdonella sp.]|uniref:shikimate dehydrogenase n=1 Tax=Dokdonella sp. TaxID=2291710 RepID=UPI003784A6DD